MISSKGSVIVGGEGMVQASSLLSRTLKATHDTCPEKRGEAHQTHRLRMHTIPQLPDPDPPLRPEIQLAPTRHHHTPLKSKVPVMTMIGGEMAQFSLNIPSGQASEPQVEASGWNFSVSGSFFDMNELGTVDGSISVSCGG